MNQETKANQLLAGLRARTTTWNEAEAFSTTLNSCLDLFAKGPMATYMGLYDMLEEAYSECPETTIQLAFWLRDPRQGAGRREAGRQALRFIAQKVGEISDPRYIAKFGRWDDLLHLPITDQCIKTWVSTAPANQLAAKWLPREKSVNKMYAKRFQSTMGWGTKQYRQFCSKHTRVVETQMCKKQWGDIVYEHVPSQAFRILSEAFQRNDKSRFESFLEEVKEGKSKVNAGAVYPHEVIKKTLAHNFYSWSNGEVFTSEEIQWKNLPNFFDGRCSTIVVADTSGSMATGEKSVRPIDVALSLALYCAERLKGPFKDNFITFSSNARFHYLDPEISIAERLQGIEEIMSNTDLMSVYKLILTTAKYLQIKQEDMPENILIISDMQFDSMVDNSIPHQRAKEMFEDAGYKAPNLIYWNVGSAKAMPITHNQAGAALVSGYSPSVLKAVFGGDLDPMSVMRRALEIYPKTLQ